MTQKQKSVLYMILPALSFAGMQVVVRISQGIPTTEQIFMRNSFVLIVVFFAIRHKKGSLFGPIKYQPYLFGRSFFGFLGLITLFYASGHAAQGDVTILNKLSPIRVTLLAVVFRKEKLSKIQIPALALSVQVRLLCSLRVLNPILFLCSWRSCPLSPRELPTHF